MLFCRSFWQRVYNDGMYVYLNLSICQNEEEYLTVFVCLCVNVTPPNEQEQTDIYIYIHMAATMFSLIRPRLELDTQR